MPASPSDPNPVRSLAKRMVYQGLFFSMDRERLLLPNGETTELEILRHPGASAIVPLQADGTVVMIRQYRHAAGGFIYEIPAGKLDPGEDPETCARREIIEEVGLSAGKLHSLGLIHTTPGFTDEIIHLFAATDLRAAAQALEHDEIIELITLPFAEAIEWARDGRITDGKTLCALFRADQALRRKELPAFGRLGP